jgi:hypothetical protein
MKYKEFFKLYHDCWLRYRALKTQEIYPGVKLEQLYLAFKARLIDEVVAVESFGDNLIKTIKLKDSNERGSDMGGDITCK